LGYLTGSYLDIIMVLYYATPVPQCETMDFYKAVSPLVGSREFSVAAITQAIPIALKGENT